MDAPLVFSLAALIFAAAVLYASVGHAGASGYLAIMALFGLAPEVMKPTALVLNVMVASVVTVKFYRAGCFSWKLFWPFAVTSIPCAFLGGALVLPAVYYRPIVGLVLLFAAWRMLRIAGREATDEIKPLPLAAAVPAGAGIGLLSGLTGVGGGIFLSPVLLLAGWATVRQTAGVSAAFIVVNSIAGLLGHVSSVAYVPREAAWWGVAAVAGGWLGAELGSRRINPVWLRRLLAAVLVLAGIKMVLL